MQRRTFLAAAASALLAPGLTRADASPRRVAVIGHTGRGNYGHGLDTVWQQIPGVEIVAVADADEQGLARELKKLGIDTGYTDYRKMLAEQRPEFVSVGPRHVDQHRDMARAAIEAGVRGLYVEKPFVRTPAEADEVIAACDKHGAKIAVAHRNRYHPAVAQIDQLLQAEEFGKLLEIRGRGKGDRRGGDEDLWVLGCHIFNLIQHFAGDPVSCSAVMLKQGRRVTADDIHEGAEGLGPLAADEVHARYETASGVTACYDSIANDGTRDAYCMQLIGSRGMITLHIDRDPLAFFLPGSPWEPTAQPRTAVPITTAGVGKPETQPELVARVHNHVLGVTDLIAACDENRPPLCDAKAGATTVEMICGVFESHRQGSASVEFPLEERRNPLTLL